MIFSIFLSIPIKNTLFCIMIFLIFPGFHLGFPCVPRGLPLGSPWVPLGFHLGSTWAPPFATSPAHTSNTTQTIKNSLCFLSLPFKNQRNHCISLCFLTFSIKNKRNHYISLCFLSFSFKNQRNHCISLCFFDFPCIF